MGRQSVLGEEVRIPRGDDAVAREQTGVPVVGVEPVALPRVVAEHDLGSQLADHARDLAARHEVAVELAVDVAEEAHLAGRGRRRAARAAARCSSWRRAASATGSARASHVPFDPSVHTR